MQQLFLGTDNAPAEGGADASDFPLGIADFTYGDLYRPERLRALADVFYAELEAADAALHGALMQYLAARGTNIAGTKQESELLIAAAPHLARFVARLFDVEREHAAQAAQI